MVYSGECEILSYQLVEITDNSSDQVQIFTRTIYDGSIIVLGQYIGAQTYLRIVAEDYGGTICSGYESLHTFYKILEQGKQSILNTNHVLLLLNPAATISGVSGEDGTITLPIPNQEVCDSSDLTFVFPNPSRPDKPCYCLLKEEGIFNFSSCVASCARDSDGASDRIELINNTVVLHDLNMYYNNETLVHYICFIIRNSPEDDYTLKTIVASYQLFIPGLGEFVYHSYSCKNACNKFFLQPQASEQHLNQQG